jgi:hypothetical protein
MCGLVGAERLFAGWFAVSVDAAAQQQQKRHTAIDFNVYMVVQCAARVRDLTFEGRSVSHCGPYALGARTMGPLFMPSFPPPYNKRQLLQQRGSDPELWDFPVYSPCHEQPCIHILQLERVTVVYDVQFPVSGNCSSRF